MHWMPSFGKALCRCYIEADRREDAVAVASTCYSYVRNQMVDHTPIQKAFAPALNNWVDWAEICGNIYVECDQKYMARQIYAMTVADLKRFNWDSPVTLMRKSSYTYFSSIFKRKLENLGPDSDDEEDSDEDAEPPIPLQRRLKLAFIQPSTDFTARVECTTLVVDIAKAPTYKALSYAWGGSRKVISYTREDGPPYAPDEDNDNSNPTQDIVLVDGQETSIRQTLFHALQQIREPNTAVAIWVDAICTNREEMKKRAAWTLRMRDIYKYAEEVIVWLGKGDEETQKGMDFLHVFGKKDQNSDLSLVNIFSVHFHLYLGMVSASSFARHGGQESGPFKSLWWLRNSKSGAETNEFHGGISKNSPGLWIWSRRAINYLRKDMGLCGR